MSKVVIITQARISSSRLPKKVLKTINGTTVLHHHLNRLKQTGLAVAVATTEEAESDLIVQEAKSVGVPATKGSLENVLARYHKTALANHADIVIRVTSDCPLISPAAILAGLALFKGSPSPEVTYCSNTVERTFPRGFDFEIFSMSLLDQAFERAVDQHDLEHVTPYFYTKKDPNIKVVQYSKLIDDSDLRLTLDTPEDLKMFEALFSKVNPDLLTDDELIGFLRKHPEITEINSGVKQKA